MNKRAHKRKNRTPAKSQPRTPKTRGQQDAAPVSPEAPPWTQLPPNIEFTAQFRGPIPPPEHLRQYESVAPGLAKRIVDMAEREQAHRHKCENDALAQEIENHRAHIKEVKRGQWLGFTLGAITIAAGIYLVMRGHPWPGSAIGVGGMASLVGVFVYTSKKPPPYLKSNTAPSSPPKPT